MKFAATLAGILAIILVIGNGVATTGATASTKVKKFTWTNNSGSAQTKRWINFTGDNLAFSPAPNSSAGWTCPVDNLSQADCQGSVADGAALTLAFLHGCGTTLTISSSGWGERGGDPDGQAPGEDEGTCAVSSVGGMAELSLAEGSELSANATSGRDTGRLRLLAAATMALIPIGGMAWYARRRWLR